MREEFEYIDSGKITAKDGKDLVLDNGFFSFKILSQKSKMGRAHYKVNSKPKEINLFFI